MSDVNFEAVAPSEDLALEVTQPAAPVRKRAIDVYTSMLIISFICLAVGTVLLWGEIGKYQNDGKDPWKTNSATPRRVSSLMDHTDPLA